MFYHFLSFKSLKSSGLGVNSYVKQCAIFPSHNNSGFGDVIKKSLNSALWKAKDRILVWQIYNMLNRRRLSHRKKTMRKKKTLRKKRII